MSGENLRLILPDTRYLESYVAALREGFRIGLRPLVPEDEIKRIEQDPFDHLNRQNAQGGTFDAEDGVTYKRVPTNHYWLVNDHDFLGSINIRYELNDFLAKHAGHIGYGTRPSMQRRGYAKKMVQLALIKMKACGTTKVMITASESNSGSWKTIEANGGVLTGHVDNIFDPGKGKSRIYWVDLEKA